VDLREQPGDVGLHGRGGVLARLRDGGLTIVIRNAATDQSQPDHPIVDLNHPGHSDGQRHRTDRRSRPIRVDRYRACTEVVGSVNHAVIYHAPYPVAVPRGEPVTTG
jgi:hypothetical protein